MLSHGGPTPPDAVHHFITVPPHDQFRENIGDPIGRRLHLRIVFTSDIRTKNPVESHEVVLPVQSDG